MAQAGKDPPFDNLHADLCLGFVLRFVRPGRDDRHFVMVSQVLIGRVQISLIPTGFGDSAFEIIRYHHLWHATKEPEGSRVRAQPVFRLLR